MRQALRLVATEMFGAFPLAMAPRDRGLLSRSAMLAASLLRSVPWRLVALR